MMIMLILTQRRKRIMVSYFKMIAAIKRARRFLNLLLQTTMSLTSQILTINLKIITTWVNISQKSHHSHLHPSQDKISCQQVWATEQVIKLPLQVEKQMTVDNCKEQQVLKIWIIDQQKPINNTRMIIMIIIATLMNHLTLQLKTE